MHANPRRDGSSTCSEYLMGWVTAACASAFFAGLVSILAKLGIRQTDSDVATAVRTCVVLAFSWLVVAVVGSAPQMTQLSASTWMFLVLSGIATGASWICYFKALSRGDINKVVPIDKSSTALATLFAIVLFGETAHLAIKLICTAIILVGTFMMIERKDAQTPKCEKGMQTPEDGRDEPATKGESRSWLVWAILAALFAALSAILGKTGIDGVESNLGTAIRTCVVLIMSWSIVAWKGKLSQVRTINRRELAFLVLSGIATGASWLCYYFAIQTGVVSVVVQIDKLSILVSVLLGHMVFGERLSRKSALGLALIVVGTVIMTAFA